MIDIRKFMAKPVITIKKTDSLEAAAKLMVKQDVSCVVVVTPSGKPIGIITERDLIEKHLAEGKDYKENKIVDIMTKNIITAPPTTTIINISKIMHLYNIKRVPIVEKGKAIGMITATDLALLMAGEK